MSKNNKIENTKNINRINKIGRSEINRKKELERITRENMGLLKRIQTAQPMYNHVEMQIESRRMDYLARHVAQREYGLDLGRDGKKKPLTSSGVFGKKETSSNKNKLLSSTLK